MNKIKRNLLVVFAVACVLALGVMLLSVGSGWFLKSIYPLKYTDIVEKNANEFSLPPSLVYGIIHTESHFDSEAVSHAGAKGLMQLMDATFEWVQKKLPEEPAPLSNIFEPSVNIRSGCKVMQILLKQFDNLETALAAYNAGSGNVSKWLKNPEYSADGVTLKKIPIAETGNYVARVLKAQKQYQTLYEMD